MTRRCGPHGWSMNSPGPEAAPRRRAALLLALLATAILAGGVLLLLMARNSEVVEKGQLLPYSSWFVYKVRFFDRFTVLVQPENKPSKDVFTAYVLVGIAFIALTFAMLHARRTRDPSARPLWFFASICVGANYLAADEFLGIHETLGANLQFLRGLPLVERPDDLFIFLYGFLAMAFFFAFRELVLASRWAVLLTATAVGLALAGAVLDLLHQPFEEILELASAGCLIAAVMLLGLDHIDPLPEE